MVVSEVRGVDFLSFDWFDFDGWIDWDVDVFGGFVVVFGFLDFKEK